jgi:ribosomal protein S27E
MSKWVWQENPDYAGRKPTLLEPDCHDRSPFVTVRCGCGFDMHVHETQIANVPAEAEIGAACKVCGRLLTIPPGWLPGAFADLRARGWIT